MINISNKKCNFTNSKLNPCDYGSIINSPKGKHKYDFKNLEYKLQSSYDKFIEDFNNHENFSKFFKDIYTIAFGILETTQKWVRSDFILTDIAHEYSTYLIERIILGKWRARVNPGEPKFSWVPYIRLNIRDTIYTKFIEPYPERHISLDEIKDSFEDKDTVLVLFEDEIGNSNGVKCPSCLVDSDSQHVVELETHHNNVAFKCTKFLKLLFGDKYYTLVSKLLSLKVENYNEIEDEELRTFTKISLVLFKRLFESYNLNSINTSKIDKIFNSTLFLASILSSDKDKSLYVSLDLSNLYRLAMSHGGSTLKVPTVGELEEIISTAKVSYEILANDLENSTNVKKIRDRVRKDFDVFIKSGRLSKNVRNVFKYLSTEIVDPSAEDNPIIKSLISLSSRSDIIINSILDKLEKSINEVEDSEGLVSIYKEMSNNLNLSINLMTNIRNLFESEFKKVNDKNEVI